MATIRERLIEHLDSWLSREEPNCLANAERVAHIEFTISAEPIDDELKEQSIGLSVEERVDVGFRHYEFAYQVMDGNGDGTKESLH